MTALLFTLGNYGNDKVSKKYKEDEKNATDS